MRLWLQKRCPVVIFIEDFLPLLFPQFPQFSQWIPMTAGASDQSEPAAAVWNVAPGGLSVSQSLGETGRAGLACWLVKSWWLRPGRAGVEAGPVQWGEESSLTHYAGQAGPAFLTENSIFTTNINTGGGEEGGDHLSGMKSSNYNTVLHHSNQPTTHTRQSDSTSYHLYFHLSLVIRIDFQSAGIRKSLCL